MPPRSTPTRLHSRICQPRCDTREIGSKTPSRWLLPTGKRARLPAPLQSDSRCNPLLSFQCTNRLPLRTRRVARKFACPAEKQRRWLVDIGNPVEAFCRGIEFAASPMRETLGIGRGRCSLLRRLLPRLRKQFVELDRGGTPLDPDSVEFTPCECRSRQRDGHLRGGDRGPVKLVGSLEPRRNVYGVAHHRIIEAPPRSDIADQRCAGIESHPMSDLVTMKGSGSLIELVETRTATECGVRRIARMVAIVGRCSEYRDNRVADILVDIAAFTFDDVGHSGKILVHE